MPSFNTVCVLKDSPATHVLSPLLSLLLSIWRWKDLSCCFLLLHYLSPRAALLAGFISDFAGWFFGGKPLKTCSWLQTIRSPLSCSARFLFYKNKRRKKKNNPRFQSRTQNVKLKSSERPPKEGESCFCSAGWHERRTDANKAVSLALLASLARYRWTSNDWLPVICVSREATQPHSVNTVVFHCEGIIVSKGPR